MSSRSARITRERPFYDLHADAYDALVTDPVEPWVEAVDERLRIAELAPASILDAGCGTGRHAQALVARGHDVALLDASPALLAIAARRCPGSRTFLTDLCAPAVTGLFSAVTCRGVLNDLLEDRERDAALGALASLIVPGGLLVLDVRESEASRRRADGAWRSRQVAVAGGATLAFSSRPTWQDGRIVVDERYELTPEVGRPASVREYTFAMRPWAEEELLARLSAVGFGRIAVEAGVGRRTPDRLLVTAHRTSDL